MLSSLALFGHSSTTNILPLQQTYHRITSLAAAVLAIHDKGGFHGDLTPRNVKFDGDSVTLVKAGSIKQQCLTYWNCERDVNLVAYSIACPQGNAFVKVNQGRDLLQMGLQFYYLLTGKEGWYVYGNTKYRTRFANLADQYYHDNCRHRTDMKHNCSFGPLYECGVPEWLVRLINELLYDDQTRRPTAKMVVEKLERGFAERKPKL